MAAGCNPKREAGIGLVREFQGEIEEARIVGVGTGSTTREALVELARRGMLDGKVVVASSLASALMVREAGLRPVMPHVVDSIDFYFDGADEVVPGSLDLLKGRGAALVGEKILASMSRLRVYVVDESKIVSRLGEKRRVPVEVNPWALSHVIRRLREMGLHAEPREGSGKDGPASSDWGGVIVDVETGPIEDPAALDRELKSIVGVVETGIFSGLADAVVVGMRGCGYRVLRVGGRG